MPKIQTSAGYKVSHVLASEYVSVLLLYKINSALQGLGWFQVAKYLKSVFLKILYVTIWSVFQNLVTINNYQNYNKKI